MSGSKPPPITASDAELPPLAFVDFMPRILDPGSMAQKMAPVFDVYSTCLSAANDWLQNNADYTPWKCETVERKVDKGPVIDLDSVTHMDASFGFNVYVRGVRMWFTKNTDAPGKSKMIGTYAFVPKAKGFVKSKDILVPKPVFGGVPTKPSTAGMIGVYKSFPKVLKKMNKTLKENPIPGTRDILPDILKQPEGINAPWFMKLPDLVTKAGMWMKEQKGIKVINIQTCDAGYYLDSSGVKIDTEKVDIKTPTTMAPKKSVRYIRVFYIVDSNAPPYDNVLLTSRLFLPVRLGEQRYETMHETMGRITAWLKLTGLPVIGVESIPFLHHGAGRGPGFNVEKSEVTVNFGAGRTWITCVRLYFPVLFQEPPPHLLPPSREWIRPEPTVESFSCSLL